MNAGQLPSIPQHMPPSFGIKNSVTVRFCNEGGMRKQRNIKALREKGISNKIKKKKKWPLMSGPGLQLYCILCRARKIVINPRPIDRGS